jgi:ferredoxin-type protein NapF
MSGATFDRSRRAFLFGAEPERLADTAFRPPWALREIFADLCTGCGACVTACPEAIVVLDEKTRAVVDFRRGAGLCSFCGACAEVCPEPVFLPAATRAVTPPWSLRAAIGDACLTRDGVMCQTCKDACGDAAIRFVYGAGRIPQPVVALDRCTGCGACVAPCPANAIAIRPAEAVDA